MRIRPAARFRVKAAGACLLLLGALPLPCSAQEWRAAIQAGLVKEPVLGLLNLPDIVTSDCLTSTVNIQLRGAPSTTSPITGSLHQPKPCQLAVLREGANSNEALPTAESDYGLPAAIAVQRDADWFRIALQQGSAWIERIDPSDFLPYPDLLKDRLTYLPRSWDGRLWEAPGSETTPLPAEWRLFLTHEIPIAFLGTRRVGNQTWIQVRLDHAEGCGEVIEGVSPLAGWMPAHRSSGAPSAWFYSRGC